MTKEFLDSYGDIKERICKLNIKLQEMREDCAGISSACGNSGHSGAISDKVGNAAVKIADCESEKTQLEIKKRKIERYIASIPDAHTRKIFYLRFIKEMPWGMVARRVYPNTNESVRKIVNRFLQKK